jgi:hypothetical protein
VGPWTTEAAEPTQIPTNRRKAVTIFIGLRFELKFCEVQI